MTEPWVSVEDVAAHPGVAKDSVYRWIDGNDQGRRGFIPQTSGAA